MARVHICAYTYRHCVLGVHEGEMERTMWDRQSGLQCRSCLAASLVLISSLTLLCLGRSTCSSDEVSLLGWRCSSASCSRGLAYDCSVSSFVSSCSFMALPVVALDRICRALGAQQLRVGIHHGRNEGNETFEMWIWLVYNYLSEKSRVRKRPGSSIQ